MSHVRRYVAGFVGSILLSVGAYAAVVGGWLSGAALVGLILALAAIQLFVQLVCFLHLGSEAKPWLKLQIFANMLVVLVIIVMGSIWIMNNLDYNMHSDMDARMMQERNKGF